jgi:CHAT domain-containing protein
VLRPDDVARREVAAVAAQLPAGARGVLLGPELTEAAFRAAVVEADALHIGVPFRLNAASPLFSRALLTAPEATVAANSGEDGLLEAREVMNLELRAGVTVLTDGGTFSMRDAAAAAGTLQWVWRAAGSAAMIVPRWTSDDPSSDRMLAEFHRRVHAGEPSAAALRASLAAVRAAEDTRAPWHWARWMILGR